MMSRKDYNRIANVFANHGYLDHNTRWVLANGIADVMEADNPLFDRGRFQQACGFDVSR